MRTPFSSAASRWSLGPRALRWSTMAALVVSVLIVLGGAVVRVTGSGLGCPTWPTCEGTSIAPVDPSIHAAIEFGNRLVTVLLVVAVGGAIIAARLQKFAPAAPLGLGAPAVRRDDRMLTRLAWSMFWLVVVNAVAGGITVLVKLNPWVVAVHFVLAIGMLTTATLTWHRARTLLRAEEPPRAPHRLRVLAGVTTAITLVLIVAGTVVTGSGPHSGDSADVPRIPVDWAVVASIHGILGTTVLLLVVAEWVLLRRGGLALAARRALFLLVVLVVQTALGLYQALSGLPEWSVIIHVFFSALIWVGTLRVLLDTDTTLFTVRAPSTAPAASTRPEVGSAL